MKRGFTLVEFLVTMVIVFVVLGGAYVAFINLLGGFKGESESIESQIEISVGIEILRLDVEHAGYGIGEEQPDLPLEISQVDTSASDTTYPDKVQLKVRSVLNNTNQSTIGWALVDCTTSFNQVAGDSIANNTPVVFLGAGNRRFISNGTFGTCPSTGFFVAVPYDASVTNGCSTQYCNSIEYILSNSQNLDTCNPYTRNLLRKVGNSPGIPVLNCVADWVVTFDVDRDGDGMVDVYDAEFNNTTSALDVDLNNDGIVSSEEVRRSVKKVNVYVLVQEGQKDPSYQFVGDVPCTTSISGKCVRTDTGAGTLELGLPTDYINYRWKVIRLFVKPMNI